MNISEIRKLNNCELLDYLASVRGNIEDLKNIEGFILAELEFRSNKIQHTLKVMEENRQSIEYDYATYISGIIN